MNKIKPTKITLEYYNKKISTEVDHSDVTLDQLHDMWLGIVNSYKRLFEGKINEKQG